ncbi:MerR family transcriptional regulator [Oryzibacter oryziterrae]|uniref:MerR family transcriptional regulator n=1 Tax=Oryzibacter oryziterrae TaxID=2766474 RepID=UPI001F15FB23|nr:MerR family transcriptional regulator [Oryzibacter oryziterrae]
MEKASDAFRTISEVAEDLDLPQHVLRFWETKFTQIRPMKRGGGRRYYRPDDVELLRGIQYLLYGEGYTIKGVQRILKEQGVRFVMDIWHNPGAPIPLDRPTAADMDEDEGSDVEPSLAADDAGEADEAYAPPPEPPMAPRVSARPLEPRVDRPAPAPFMAAAVAKATQAQPVEEDVLPAGILPEGAPARGGFKFMDRFRGGSSSDHGATHASATGALSREDIRRLQSTLFELLECKRLLDQTR